MTESLCKPTGRVYFVYICPACGRSVTHLEPNYYSINTNCGPHYSGGVVHQMVKLGPVDQMTC